MDGEQVLLQALAEAYRDEEPERNCNAKAAAQTDQHTAHDVVQAVEQREKRIKESFPEPSPQ